MHQDGKTLMEIMVTVAVVGIIAGLAVPNFLSWHSRIQSGSALEEIASELRLARQLAITRRERVRIVFDGEQQSLSAYLVNSETLHHVYSYADKGIVVDEPSAGPDLLFHPSGRTATATTIRLRDRLGDMRTMTVSMTGRVSGS
jgi:type IV fimbrial biogenesis protein FimT